jgi:hypothetical protein
MAPQQRFERPAITPNRRIDQSFRLRFQIAHPFSAFRDPQRDGRRRFSDRAVATPV